MSTPEATPPWAAQPRASKAAAAVGDTAGLRQAAPDGWWRVVVPGCPVAKPRHRTGKGRVYTTDRQVCAEHLVARCAVEQNAGRAPIVGPVKLRVVAVMPTRSAARYGRPLIGRPDLDNLVKLVCDGLNGAGVWADDAAVAACDAYKVFGRNPRTVIDVMPLERMPSWVQCLGDAS